MSLKFINLAYQFPCREPGEQSVLVALSDNADTEGKCWPSISELARKTAYSERNVSRLMGSLCQSGRVSIVRRNGVRNCYKIATPTPDNLSPLTDCHPRQIVTPDRLSPLTDCQGTPDRLSPLHIEGTVKEPSTTESSDAQKKNIPAKARTKKKFIPPTLDEWLAQGATLDPPYFGPDAESAFYFYDAKGWLVGKAPMKNWRSAMMTCYRRWQGMPGRSNGKAPVNGNGHSKPSSSVQQQSEADLPGFSETPDGKMVNEIIAAYEFGTQACMKLLDVRRIILPHVKRGLGPEILAKVQEIAGYMKKWPFKDRQFLPSAHSFFSECRWNDDPKAYKKEKSYIPW